MRKFGHAGLKRGWDLPKPESFSPTSACWELSEQTNVTGKRLKYREVRGRELSGKGEGESCWHPACRESSAVPSSADTSTPWRRAEIQPGCSCTAEDIRGYNLPVGSKTLSLAISWHWVLGAGALGQCQCRAAARYPLPAFASKAESQCHSPKLGCFFLLLFPHNFYTAFPSRRQRCRRGEKFSLHF